MAKDESHNLPFCIYPPVIAIEVDVTEQIEGDLTRYIIRNKVTSEYFQLKSPEYKIFKQITGWQNIADIVNGGSDNSAPKVTLPALIKFLTRLDSLNLLARGGINTNSTPPEKGLYPTFRLFNPDKFLSWTDNKFGWVFTKTFIITSLLVIVLALFGIILRGDECTGYVSYTYATYGLWTILFFTLTITAFHEFAHGLACKHFGGEVKEIGLLLIYYVMPAFYCNISDIYRIGRKRERLWVIGAGIYWQLLVSSTAGLIWILSTPYSLLADFSFLVFLGGMFTVLINCNPLIKLDGYYALSQILGVQNLQAQSSLYVRALFNKWCFNTFDPSVNRERPFLYIGYWLGSITYSLLLIIALVRWVGNWLMDDLGVFGVLLTIALFGLLTKKWWKPAYQNLRQAKLGFAPQSLEGKLVMSNQATLQRKNESSMAQNICSTKKSLIKRKLILKGAFALFVVAAMITPWEASSSSDCTLQLPPGQEGVVRANINAVLSEVYVHPGDVVGEGTKIAHLSNPEMEDRLAQINAEILRLDSNNSRLEDEVQVRSEALLSASFKETERKRILSEMKNETSQINSAIEKTSSPLPPSLAILQSEIELKQTELEHNSREVERYKKLYEQQLIGTQVYDRAVAAMKISEKELQTAKVKLEAAIVEHRRLTSSTETTSLIAETESRAARSNFEALIAELSANRQQLDSLKQRQEILRREYEGMNVTAPRSGVILGDDLQKQIGSHYNLGQEICRLGVLENFLLKIEVSEREISSVKLDNLVRFKLKTLPGKTFTGRVSKINAEPNTNQNGQRFYPVEVLVDNAEGMLRPGMTGFARINFGRQSVGLILAEKVWQALRPELWLF